MFYWRAAICAGVIFGGTAVSPPIDLGFISVSPAEAKAYYTRKRVNGRWITGRFAKKGTAATRIAYGSRSAERSPDASTRVAALSAFSTPVMSAAAPAPVERPVTAPRHSPASSLAQAGPLAAAAPGSAFEDDRLSKLREALQARASALTTGSVAAQQGLRPGPEPQSVSLDFKSGTKTTVFSDGTSVTEPFDVAALKGLAAPPPPAKADLK
jgi:hypothetical protein